jgi:predicted dehydrogenase
MGVVGLGLIAQVVHIPNLVRLADRFAVVHLSDLSSELMSSVSATVPGSPRCSLDAADLIADADVDAVLLLTPGAHAPLAEVALLAGKHVISEKPFCITQAEARRLGDLARERDLVLQVAYMKAYDPAIPAARRAIADIGDVQLVSVEVRHPTHQNQIERLAYRTAGDVDMSVVRAMEALEVERTVDALGEAPVGIGRLYREVLLGSVIHELAAIRALGFQPPAQWQHVAAWPFDVLAAEGDPPSLAATARLAGGATLRLQWLWVPDYPRYEETISIVGSAGAIQLDMPQPYGPNVAARLRVRASDGRSVEVVDGRHTFDSGFLEELRVFHAAIVDQAPVPTGAEAARADTASLQAFVATLAAQHGATLGGEAAGQGSPA